MTHRNDDKHAALLGDPADVVVTNLLTWSRDLTQAAQWNVKDAVVTYDQEGIYGDANGASLVVDNSGDDPLNVTAFGNISAPAGFTVIRWIVKAHNPTKSVASLSGDTGTPLSRFSCGVDPRTRQLVTDSFGVAKDFQFEVYPFNKNWQQVILSFDHAADPISILNYPAVGYGFDTLTPDASAQGELIIGNIEVIQGVPVSVVRTLPAIFSDGSQGTYTIPDADHIDDLERASLSETHINDAQYADRDGDTQWNDDDYGALGGTGHIADLRSAGSGGGGTLKNDLVSWYDFDDISDSHGANDLTNVNAVSFSGSKATFVRASSQYLEVASSPFDFNSDFSLAIRFTTTTPGATPDRVLVASSSAVSPVGLEFILQVDYATSQLAMWVGDGVAYKTVAWPVALIAGTTYNAVIYYDAINSKIGIRLNAGTASELLSVTINNTSPFFRVGRWHTGADRYHDGDIFYLGIWSRLLTDTEIEVLNDDISYSDL